MRRYYSIISYKSVCSFKLIWRTKLVNPFSLRCLMIERDTKGCIAMVMISMLDNNHFKPRYSELFINDIQIAYWIWNGTINLLFIFSFQYHCQIRSSFHYNQVHRYNNKNSSSVKISSEKIDWIWTKHYST
jgi:hypothetical protein